MALAVLLPEIPDFFSHTFSKISYHAMASSTEQSMCSLPKARTEAACLALVPYAWPFLWAVDPVESEAFSFVVVQDFDSVAVEDGDDGARKIRGNGRRT